jgi:hypothetical protein
MIRSIDADVKMRQSLHGQAPTGISQSQQQAQQHPEPQPQPQQLTESQQQTQRQQEHYELSRSQQRRPSQSGSQSERQPEPRPHTSQLEEVEEERQEKNYLPFPVLEDFVALINRFGLSEPCKIAFISSESLTDMEANQDAMMFLNKIASRGCDARTAIIMVQ